MSSVLQPNTHDICATYIFYQISPTCFSVLYTILRENYAYLLNTVRFLQGCYIRCVMATGEVVQHTATCRGDLEKNVGNKCTGCI